MKLWPIRNVAFKVMAYKAVACVGMAYIVMTHIVMACIVIAVYFDCDQWLTKRHITWSVYLWHVMAYIGMAHSCGYTVMAYIVMANSCGYIVSHSDTLGGRSYISGVPWPT